MARSRRVKAKQMQPTVEGLVTEEAARTVLLEAQTFEVFGTWVEGIEICEPVAMQALEAVLSTSLGRLVRDLDGLDEAATGAITRELMVLSAFVAILWRRAIHSDLTKGIDAESGKGSRS